LLSERPDGRGLSANVQVPAGSVNNQGQITADAGTIALQAQVVNQNGVIQADSIQNQNGVVELVASDQLNLGSNSKIVARGDDSTAGSSGGDVTLQSGNNFSDSVGSQIITAGGALGGNGGDVEISAPNVLSLNSSIDARAPGGGTAGKLLLDPAYITLDTSGTGSAGTGTVLAGSNPTGTLDLNVNIAFANLAVSQIILQATADITLTGSTVWNLSGTIGKNFGGVTSGQLTLEAGGSIIFGNKSQIVDANNWSVNLEAGVDFSSGKVQPGLGSILINSGDIDIAKGSINLAAGQDILVTSGYVNTYGGGNIVADALSGNVNAGVNSAGYTYGNSSTTIPTIGIENSGYGYYIPTVNGINQVGGISTVAGGNVTLEAGQNVISVPTSAAACGSGAYGQEPGNVTIVAGNQIQGNYLVRNGQGLLEAGVTVQNGQITISNPAGDIGVLPANGLPAQPVDLSLISGSWTVYAAQDVDIGEVRNPNGVFNANKILVPPGTSFPGNIDGSGDTTAAPTKQSFLFDYSSDAAASIWAGNSITLGNISLPRSPGALKSDTSIYPPDLSLTAGAGGVNIDNNIILYPSSQGALVITTLAGGNLNGVFQLTGGGTGGTETFINMSDSGLPDWSTFATGQAATPLHLNDPNPIMLNISGSIENLTVNVPTFADITVGGNTYNFNFTGQNLSASQTTTFNVAGNITYRGNLTDSDATLSAPPAASLLQVSSNLIYDSLTGKLVYVGQMDPATEAALLSDPSVQASTTLTGIITQLYTDSQTAVLPAVCGIGLNGPGSFNITAQSMDLGISGGINVNQKRLWSLTNLDPYGAALNINLSGNLEMTTTEISNAGLLGSIQIYSAGTIDAGADSGVYGAANAARGIFTSGGGSVSVTALNDVNVDGSRIATFNGGNVSVISQQGDVNAGAGGNGLVALDSVVQLDASGNLEELVPAEAGSLNGYGSGILAQTLTQSGVPVGNITVQATHGSINANVGGIEQVAFNNDIAPGSYIDLTAGQDINAGNSGVIGSDIKVTAGGNISGIFVGSGGVNINAGNNFSGTVVGSTEVSLSAGGSISGTVIGGGNVSVSGQTVTADIVGATVSATGDTTGATEGVSTANVPQQTARVADDSSSTASTDNEDDEKKKKGKSIALAQKVSRVTVILPQSTTPHTP
jgi:hypothetical protein